MAHLTVSVSTTIDRSRDDVYALVDDLAAHERWTDHFLTDWEVEGDIARMKVKGGGRSEIRTVSSTPDAIVEEGTDGKRRTRGTYTLEPVGADRTEVTFTNEILERASKVEAVLDPLVKAFLRRNNAKALARLKAILESEN
jgi:uncharacterized protein YndB with AHSA1/START domain